MELKKVAKNSINTIYISAIFGFIETIIFNLIDYTGIWNDICDTISLTICLIGCIVFSVCILIRTIQIYKEIP